MRNVEKQNKIPADHLILGENQYYSRDGIKTQLNNNVVVVGTSGAGKTRSIVIPNLLQAYGSYVVSDPKGNLSKKLGPYLKAKGYKVITIDFIHPEESLRYNPITHCKNTTDVQKLAHMIVNETSSHAEKASSDPFWDLSSQMMYQACIGYLLETDEFD